MMKFTVMSPNKMNAVGVTDWGYKKCATPEQQGQLVPLLIGTDMAHSSSRTLSYSPV